MTDAEGRAIRQLIDKMRSDRARFRVVPGGTDAVDATQVDDWADELEALAAAGGAPHPQPDKNDQMMKALLGAACPKCFRNDDLVRALSGIYLCGRCGWTGTALDPGAKLSAWTEADRQRALMQPEDLDE